MIVFGSCRNLQCYENINGYRIGFTSVVKKLRIFKRL